MYPIIVLLVPPSLKIHSVSHTTSRCEVTRYFETSVHRMAPKMTNPTKSNVSQKCITGIQESQMSVRFVLRPAGFVLQDILRIVDRMTPKMTLNPTRSNVRHICVTSIHESLYNQPFSSYRRFWDKCIEWPQNDIEPYNGEWLSYVLLVSTNSKFHSISLYDQPFLSYRPCWGKCTQWPHGDL